MVAKIAVSAANFAIDKPYSYAVPEGLTVRPGMRVIVPFGRGNRRCEGIVLELSEEEAHGLKTVEERLDEDSVLSETMLRLAAFLRERYFCTFYDAARAMLPAGLWFRKKETFSLTGDDSWKTADIRQKDAMVLLQLLEQFGGEAPEESLREAIGDEERFRKAVAYLTRKKWIDAKQEFSRRASDKTEKMAELAVSVESAMEYAAQRPKSALMQKNVLELLCTVGRAPVKEILYYTGASMSTVKRLSELGYVNLTEEAALRLREILPTVAATPIVLTDEQAEAFQGLSAQMDRETPGTALLYGVTGSGKTSIYLKLIQKTLDAGKSAILLVPEIALTPQLLGLVAAYFGDIDVKSVVSHLNRKSSAAPAFHETASATPDNTMPRSTNNSSESSLKSVSAGANPHKCSAENPRSVPAVVANAKYPSSITASAQARASVYPAAVPSDKEARAFTPKAA